MQAKESLNVCLVLDKNEADIVRSLDVLEEFRDNRLPLVRLKEFRQ